MADSKLAILGGTPVVEQLGTYRSIGGVEVSAVTKVLESQCLSGFYGSPGPEFLGGSAVRRFEALWSERFNVQHSVSMNSNTSSIGLTLIFNT